jgi:hypothetical protein
MTVTPMGRTWRLLQGLACMTGAWFCVIYCFIIFWVSVRASGSDTNGEDLKHLQGLACMTGARRKDLRCVVVDVQN